MPSRPASRAEPGERPSFDRLAGPVLEPKALNPVQLPWIRAREQNSPSGLLLWPNSHFHSVSAQTLCPPRHPAREMLAALALGVGRSAPERQRDLERGWPCCPLLPLMH